MMMIESKNENSRNDSSMFDDRKVRVVRKPTRHKTQSVWQGNIKDILRTIDKVEENNIVLLLVPDWRLEET